MPDTSGQGDPTRSTGPERAREPKDGRSGWARSQTLQAQAHDASAFALLLRELRVQARLSQQELARRAGVDPAYVNRLERGRRPPVRISRSIVLRLCWVTEASDHELDCLLSAAGLLPESVLAAGGWDAYLRLWRGELSVAERKLELLQAETARQSSVLADLVARSR